MKESSILAKIELAIGSLAKTITWRHNTGQAWMGKFQRVATPGMVRVNAGDVVIRNARPVKFGLPGSGDIIGLRSITIDESMVGKTIGQFISVEVKTKTGRLADQQAKFGGMVRRHGGIYVVATSPEEATAALESLI